MIKFIKNLFSNKDNEENKEMTAECMFDNDEIETSNVDCNNCSIKSLCSDNNIIHECENSIDIGDYNPDLDTVLIIDDNEGMISFLMDDMDYFVDKGIIDKDKLNILPISGLHAAFSLKLLYEKLPRLNIKHAIIDITLGGSKMTKEGNIKYTGVDVFSMIYKNNPDFRFLFYTGNNLNPYIKSNEKLISQFKELTGGDIKKHVLFKTSMDISSRRKYIQECLFDK